MPADSPSAFPKLARSINILVAGHQEARLAGQGAAARRRLEQLLERFGAYRDAGQARDLFGDTLYAQGDGVVRLITGHCDGVDAWARALGERLALPVSVVDGAAPGAGGLAAGAIHFGCPADILTGDDPVHALRDEFALLHADLLLAVWDGKAARGQRGGVVRMIQHAVQVGVPVLWIDLQGQLRELDYTRVDDTTRFQLAHVDLRAVAADAIGVFGAAVDDPVVPSLRRWLDPLKVAGEEKSETDELAMLRLYAQEGAGLSLMERFVGLSDRVLTAAFWKNRTKLRAAFSKKPLEAYLDLPQSVTPPASLEARLRWSDVRAIVAAGQHRGGVWLMYLLASMAVFAAIAGSLYLGVEHEGWSSLFWPVCEGVILVTILWMLRQTRNEQWHPRWLGQRQIAEQLRYLLMTRPVLGLTGFFSLPPLRYDPQDKKVRLVHPEAWLVRRTLIAEGLPHGAGGYDLHSSTEGACVIANHLIDAQVDYHEDNVDKLKTIHHTMHGTARVLFILALLSVLAHLLAPLIGQHAPAYLLFATAFFPSLAAALHGIQTKLEMARVHAQSHATLDRLNALSKVIAQHASVPHANPWQQTLYLRSAILSAASIMSDEAQSWNALIAQQDAELPA